ncbi:MAG TPA: ABC transporter ATP-binding protein [Solirubrobacteraceae bacterium]|jgi:peptide/nickel transport system ATP-binding protein|nr:ABC transporter ATP-binding protein [Solirubrobacteraceae bacterium]
MSTVEQSQTGASQQTSADALTLSHVDITYRVRRADQRVVRDVSFHVAQGESYGLVGESGCGKSTIALSIVRYLARNGRVSAGGIEIDGRDVLALKGHQLQQLRARTVSMVYQEPGRALNPSILVGRQVAEVYEIAGLDRKPALAKAQEMLERVKISDPKGVMGRYPHQLSGGMLQRVVIAMALASEPSLLILDEPTTALDATVEAEVLDLILGLRSEFNTSLLFISHNLAVIAKMCDRVGVLYAGELVEEGAASEVFRNPRHPYTVGLLRSIPRRDPVGAGSASNGGRPPLSTIPGSLPAPGSVTEGCVFAARCGLADDRCRTEAPPLYEIGGGRGSRCHYHERAQTVPLVTMGETSEVADGGAGEEIAAPAAAGNGRRGDVLLSLRSASKTFHMGGQTVRGLYDVDLDIAAGETVGLVGESGSGKTTLARVAIGLTAPDAGSEVTLGGHAVAGVAPKRSAEDQKALQIVFQNPDSALNRRHSVRRLISRSLSKLGGYRGERLQQRLKELIQSVRLSERYLSMRPSQLSGGLKQRVAIARAFAGDPRIVICDEPTSALDVSVQAAILNLLTDLQRREDVSYLFISHDLGVVRYLADRIVVLYLGRVMEVGPASDVFAAPHHPYTEALLSAVPTLDDTERLRIRLEGEIPSAADPPTGCPFHTRCPRKIGAICETTEPELREEQPGHGIRCHIPLADLRRLQAVDTSSAPAGTTSSSSDS